MIREETMLEVADNSGAKIAKCIRVLGGSGRRCARAGDVIVVAIQTVIAGCKTVKKGSVTRALIVRERRAIKESAGLVIRFSSNSVVLIGKQGELIGTRVFRPVSRRLRQPSFLGKEAAARVLTLAPEVL